MFEPGYYKSNYRALSLREVARMRGLLRLPLAYLITRFKAATPAAWMPQSWSDLECPEHMLSPQFFAATGRHREAFRKLGFTEVGFKKLRRVLNPYHRDDGGINFLDASQCHFGQIIYNRSRVPPPVNKDRHHVVIAFTAALEKGSFNCTNKTKTAFDTVPHQKVVRIQSDEVAEIYREFVGGLKRRKEQPRRFSDLNALRSWFDSNATETFAYRVRRGLFIRMSDAEVAVAQRKFPPPIPND